MLDLSKKLDSAPPEIRQAAQILKLIQNGAQELRVSFFVIGATARDILFQVVYEYSKSSRASQDLDIALLVQDWEEYDHLREALILTQGFLPTGQKQRLLAPGGYKVDIVPFGPLTGSDHKLAWPPDANPVISTLGFEEAFRCTVPIRLSNNPDFDVPFCTPAALVMLKFISWDDQPSTRGKDAEDILYMMEGYMEAGNYDRLAGDARDLIEDDFDLELAGARLLGRDIRALAQTETTQQLQIIIDREIGDPDSFRLVEAMERPTMMFEDASPRVRDLLREFGRGFAEGHPRTR